MTSGVADASELEKNNLMVLKNYIANQHAMGAPLARENHSVVSMFTTCYYTSITNHLRVGQSVASLIFLSW